MTQSGPILGSTRLTEEQLLLREAVRVLADERVAPRAAAIDRDGVFPEDMRALLAASLAPVIADRNVPESRRLPVL